MSRDHGDSQPREIGGVLSLTVPHGWVLIDPRTGDVRPREAAEVLAGIDLAGLTEVGAYAVLVSVAPLLEMNLNAAITVLPLADVEGATPMDIVLAMAAENPASSLLDLPGLVGLRLSAPDTAEWEEAAGPQSEPPHADPPSGSPITDSAPEGVDTADLGEVDTGEQRSVRYIIGEPGTSRWLDIHCRVRRDDDNAELADALVVFFDAWVQTVTWAEPEEVSSAMVASGGLS